MKEECGIAAFYSKKHMHIPLHSLVDNLKQLQHRGRESAGITQFNDKLSDFVIYKDFGLISEALDNKIKHSHSKSSISHTRYSTSGNKKENTSLEIQPFLGEHPKLGKFALAHNGNLPALTELLKQYPNINKNMNTNSDSEFLLRYLENSIDTNWDNIIKKMIQDIPGIYSLIIQVISDDNNDIIYLLKDRYGIRPLVIGENSDSYFIASETIGLPLKIQSIMNHYEIRAGEIWKLDRKLSKIPILVNKNTSSYSNMCLFEFIYFQRPKSQYQGKYIKDIRYNLGEKIAELDMKYTHKSMKNTIVVGMPNSAIPAGMGYADYIGVPYQQIIWKEKNCGRTFILPVNDDRIKTIKKKIKFNHDQLYGKSIILVDDSIVRGNTIRAFVQKLRKIGVDKIHIRVISPPIKYPCFMGVDIPSVDELIANNKTNEQIKNILNVDSLKYLSIKDIHQVLGTKLCTGCFTGKYPPGLLDW